MKMKHINMAMGLAATLAVTSVQAGAYSPLAADRYGASPFVSQVLVAEKETQVSAIHIEAREPQRSYQAFAANSYKASPFKFRAAREPLDTDVQVGQFEGTGFKLFSADRYYK
ncbi:hypothetical protein Tel_15015 [Candidatus Tenderia electrophaga]|jgi:hypothetical protein|uniref:Uncharacterized protein n=1 Tax=Candidatus Tenderia electrophaga TaxID=1748243 RepID=A0A0S2TGR8_9GAMM|nr:hypothetical protein Tel_15015 [Candidatus Tenderia electrophaga]